MKDTRTDTLEAIIEDLRRTLTHSSLYLSGHFYINVAISDGSTIEFKWDKPQTKQHLGVEMRPNDFR
jgi:hypothetical protein